MLSLSDSPLSQIPPHPVDRRESEKNGHHPDDEDLRLSGALLPQHLNEERGSVQLGEDHHGEPGIDHELLAHDDGCQKEARGEDPEDVSGQADPEPETLKVHVKTQGVRIVEHGAQNTVGQLGNVLDILWDRNKGSDF